MAALPARPSSEADGDVGVHLGALPLRPAGLGAAPERADVPGEEVRLDRREAGTVEAPKLRRLAGEDRHVLADDPARERLEEEADQRRDPPEAERDDRVDHGLVLGDRGAL